MIQAHTSLFPETADQAAARIDAEIVRLLFGGCSGPLDLFLADDERIVLAAVRFHRGRDRAISIDELQQHTHLNGRSIKAAVRGLRMNFHLPIGSSKHSTKGGYFIILTPEDLSVWQADVLDQVRAELAVLRAAAGHQAGLEMLGQLRDEMLNAGTARV